MKKLGFQHVGFRCAIRGVSLYGVDGRYTPMYPNYPFTIVNVRKAEVILILNETTFKVNSSIIILKEE